MSRTAKLKFTLRSKAGEAFRQVASYRPHRNAVMAAALTAAISTIVVVMALPSKIMANDSEVRTFTVDVAFRKVYFQNNVDPAETLTDGSAFSQGDTFIQDGTVYPEGTIPNGKTDFDPDNTPGAIGVYRARGTWTTDLANFQKAANKEDQADSDMAFATEIFSFDNDRGSILTDGMLPNAYFSGRRVVLGGTRAFRDIVGEVHEENIGENNVSCNLRVTFRIRRAGDAHGR